MTAKRPTMTDVARQAGVSKATVSAVLNGTAGVKDATRDRVHEAMDLLNYRPLRGGAASSSQARADKSIALLIKEHDNPYYAGIIDGVRAVCTAQGYTLLVASSAGDYETERRSVELLRAKYIDGLIVTPVLDDEADLSHLFELKRRNFPFVLLEEIRGLRASLVDVDNVAASRMAVEHLLSLGHTRIAHLAGPQYSLHSQQRVNGARLAHSASQVAFPPQAVVPAGAHLQDGYRAGLALFSGAEPAARPTAVTCYNDLVAIGLCRALAELGLDVPGDVSVVGFDDIPLCQYVPVPLTSVRVPTYEMGEIAARMLLHHVEANEVIPPQRVDLQAELVVRRSTAAVGAVALPSSPSILPFSAQLTE
ncbi:MAG TPA: LacI family DNA-binding transcriptional regulator [Gemmatimonadaceae bacterium]|nr:LacI family DNA-binding transcriptional regulator [Gemmatimonadaceae bacterium]